MDINDDDIENCERLTKVVITSQLEIYDKSMSMFS